MANQLGVHASVWVGGWTREDCRAAVRRTAAAGYDLLEIPALDPAAIDAADTRAVLRDHGLRGVCSLGLDADCDPSSPYEEVARRGEERLADALRVVEAIGGDYLGGVVYSALGKYETPADPRGRANVIPVLARLADRAADAGVTVGLEPVNRYESNVCNTVAQATEIIDEVGAGNLVVHLDVYHANIEERSPAAAVRAAGPRLGYVHVGESHRGFLGTGTVDFPAFFAALAESGYRGPVTFETFSRAVVSDDLSNRLAVWRNLWDDGTEIAVHAREFIERHLAGAAR